MPSGFDSGVDGTPGPLPGSELGDEMSEGLGAPGSEPASASAAAAAAKAAAAAASDAPSSPGFAPGNSPGPGGWDNIAPSSEFGVPNSVPAYATPLPGATPTPSRATNARQQGASAAGGAAGAPGSVPNTPMSGASPMVRGTTPLPRADLGTHQRSAVRRSRQRHGELPPVSPASIQRQRGLRHSAGLPSPAFLGAALGERTPMSASRAGGNTPLGPNAAAGVGASEADAPYPDAVPPSEGSTFSSSAGSEQDQAVLWGTNIAVHESMRDFRRFLTEFRLETEPADAEPYYMRLLAEIHESQTFNINIDCKNLHDFPATRRLYEQLERYPAEIIPILDLVVHQEYLNMFGPDSLDRSRIQVRTFNLREVKTMRDLNPEDIDQMVAVRGMITRTSAVLPDIKLGFFRCSACQGTMEVMLDRGKIQEPSQCPHCQEKWSMELVHNRCWFADKQMIKLQEAPENIAEGETPTTMTLYAFDDLVDVGRPGDRVEVTGIFRAVPVRSNPRRRSVHSVYKTYIDVIHFRKSAKGRLTAEDATAEEGSEFHTTFDEGDETTHIRDERRARLEELSRDPEIYNKLTAALAPSIWELDDVKKGVLLMLFGGVHKKIVNKSLRGEINVLLCGDPGTSKSQLLSYVHKIAPRGLYTSGKGTSAVGLTAYVYKDPETKELTLESGALVLSDRGVCCIDEFDKMSDSARSILHEAMEQQTVSIAKAGIIATLNARTSVLASANPIESRYNPSMSIVENINLTPTLLSRFDLIYLILDKPNAETDRRLARHLVALFYKEGEARRSETLEPRLLAEYISYARRHIHPDISEEAAAALVEGYVDMRLVGTHANRGKKLITATPRQLESLIRLSEAHARLHFRRAVLREDVEEAVRLMNVATQRAATDPTTGTIDMDMITTGHTAAARQLIQVLAAEVRNMLASNMRGKTVTFMEIQRAMESDTVTVEPDHLEEALRHLADANVIAYNEMTRSFHVAEVF